MKKGIILVCMVTVILAAGCGSTKLESLQRSTTTPSMKQQTQNTIDELNAAMPYIVDWSGYQSYLPGYGDQEKVRIASELATAYPSLKKYINAEGLFNPADHGKVDDAINTEDPNPAKGVRISL